MNTSHETLQRNINNEPINDVVSRLLSGLSASTIAYAADIKDKRAVKQWAKAERTPNRDAALRLRIASVLVGTVADPEYPGVQENWLIGCDPRLDEQTPVEFVRQARAEEGITSAVEIVYASAVAFSESA